MVQYAEMKANDIIADARMLHLRELKESLAATKERLQKAEAERDLLLAHFPLAMVALDDFKGLSPQQEFRIIDGWNAILRQRNISKLSSADVSRMKKEYLANLGITSPAPGGADVPSVGTWIVFDGETAASYRSGEYRVTYTGGTGPHRADRMILDFVNAAKVLGLDVSRISVETADKDLSKRLSAVGAKVQ